MIAAIAAVLFILIVTGVLALGLLAVAILEDWSRRDHNERGKKEE